MPQQQQVLKLGVGGKKKEFSEMSKIPSIFRFAAIFFIASSSSADQTLHSRHLLHQPFFPVITAAPPPYQPPSSSEPPSPSPHRHHHHKKQPATPAPHEKHLFSSVTNPPPPPPSHPHQNPFFPSSDPYSTAAHPPPPPPPPTSLPTFPANISSLLFPTHNNPSKSHHNRHIAKLVAVTVSVVSAAVLLSLFAVFIIFLRRTRYRRRSSPADDTKSIRSDSLQLFNAAPSDGSLKHKQHQQPPKYASSNTSSEFLYLGTLVNSRSGGLDQQKSPISVSGSVTGVLELPAPASSSSSSSYSQFHKLGSPELRPLPPLPKLPAFTPTYQSTEQLNPKRQDFDGDDNENDEFYSPRGSSGRKQSPTRVWASLMKDSDVDQIGRLSINGSNSCSPTNSVPSMNGSPATNMKPKSLSPRLSLQSQSSLNDGVSKQPGPARPPPPPPPPPTQFVDIPATISHSPPRVDSDPEKKEEALRPKLKPLHWDKVRASSSRVTVWDQIKSNSFQLNEEMIETLFRANDPSSRTRDAGNAGVVQSANQENQLLDPRKSHNIAILLRALNVTADEVCEALVEGNSDTLGPELLECLLKMAPTKDEENKLKELKDDDDESSPSKIGPAEKFLKALLDIPFAFKRIDAMLYIVNFESETEYLKRSFDTLEAACGELKNTRMFLKLLEAVLKTGNRMNIGTNRGDAHAFKLDTLLKLVDIKGADGKTTLLHFVVQEIIKSEGARVSSTPNQSSSVTVVDIAEQSAFQDDLELKKLGLQVVSGLSSQLINVKKAAAVDLDSLSNETAEIAEGITKVKEVISEVKQETGVERFLDSMNSFLSKAEEEVTEMQSRGSNVMKMVKEVTEYFHGNSESHPFRIFAVVRDFLTTLDQVCKEVGRVNERTVYGSVPRHPVSNQAVTPLFPVVNNNDSRPSHSGSLENDEDSF